MYMSDKEVENEIFEPLIKDEPKPEPKAEPEPMPPIPEETAKPEKVKKPRKKRVFTEAQLEQLKLNLAKGRATSLAKRRKKAQIKKIDKDEKSKHEDERILKALKTKLEPDAYKKENDSLKKQLADLKLEMSSKKERKRPDTPPTPTPTPTPKKTAPVPIVKKQLTAKQKMKMMRFL